MNVTIDTQAIILWLYLLPAALVLLCRIHNLAILAKSDWDMLHGKEEKWLRHWGAEYKADFTVGRVVISVVLAFVPVMNVYDAATFLRELFINLIIPKLEKKMSWPILRDKPWLMDKRLEKVLALGEKPEGKGPNDSTAIENILKHLQGMS